MSRPAALKPDRWASVGRDVQPAVAEHRHLVRKGGLTSRCGATASMPEVWRGDSRKPQCPACLAAPEPLTSPRSRT